MSTATQQRVYLGGPWVLLVLLSVGVSIAALLWPLAAGGVAVVLVLTIVAAGALVGLRFWQQITLIGLMGYVVLGYGFANFTLPHTPVPVGHVVMFGGLLVALPGRGADVRAFVREPMVWCWLALAGLTLLHLIVEIPQHGIWAIRDSNFVVEGIFLLSGFLWARQRGGFPSMMRSLLAIFVINFVYSLTYPIEETVAALSPRSGVFLDVPILGTYWHNSLFLVCGALFVFLLGREAFKWSAAAAGGFALLQIALSLIFQHRSNYVGMVIVPMILVLTGERGRAGKAIGGMAMGILLIVAVGMLGIPLEGRIGTLTPEFFLQHLRSIVLAPDTPSVGTTQWRVEQGPQIVARVTASPGTMLIGEGFGQPLVEWEVSAEIGQEGTGVQVRAPHNTHITALMRLGLLGLLFWALMHARITYLLVRGVRAASRLPVGRLFAVWILAFYVLGMLHTSVQPWLEFSHGAISFYVLIGFAIGLASPNVRSRGE